MAEHRRPTAVSSDLMTPAQVAEYLQLHKLTIYRYIREGRLPAMRIGRALRIERADVDLLLEEGRRAVVRSGRGISRRREGGPRREPAAEEKAAGPAQEREEIYVGPSREEKPKSRDVVVTVSPIDWVVRGLH